MRSAERYTSRLARWASRRMLGLIMVTCVGLSVGCAEVGQRFGAMNEGELVLKMQAGEAAMAREAEQDGTYALYGKLDIKPRLTAELKRGEMVGFRRDRAGELRAVYGIRERALAEGDYAWYRW